jgi:hypothetical protein
MLDNFSRQLGVFKPLLFKKSVDVIGAGATGSHVAYTLAKMGVRDLTVFDFDVIEDHNLPNQLYRPCDVGKPKVEALAHLMKEFADLDIKAVNAKVEEGFPYAPGNIVFLLTDTMSSRREIFNSFLRLNFNVKLVIETRMGADNGRVYSFCPTNIKQVEEWEKTLYADDVAETSLCGSSTSVAATAINLATLAVWQMLIHNMDEKPDFEIIYGLKPLVSLNKTV